MDVLADAGAEIRPHPADRLLVVQAQLKLLAQREQAGASNAELAVLVAELRQLQGW